MEKAPPRVTQIGVLCLVLGIINIMAGWGMSALVWMMVGGACSLVLSLGTCPAGMFCGFVPFLIIPLSLGEVILGAVVLGKPDSLRRVFGFLPLLLMATIVVGDLISPIVGLVVFFLGRDPEVRAWRAGE